MQTNNPLSDSKHSNSKSLQDDSHSDQMKQIVINALEELKADNVTVLDVSKRTSVTDYMVIASGTSSRHVKSLADNVIAEVKEHGGKTLGIEGAESSDWVLVDLGGIVVHVMMPATRTFYDLERFWLEDTDSAASSQH